LNSNSNSCKEEKGVQYNKYNKLTIPTTALVNDKKIENLNNLTEIQNSKILIDQMKLIQAENEKLKTELAFYQKKDLNLSATENIPKSETKLGSINLNQEKVEEMEIKITIDARSEIKAKKQKNLQIEMMNDQHKIKDYSKNKPNTQNSVKKPTRKHSKKEKNDSDYDIEVEIEDNDLSQNSDMFINNIKKINSSQEDKSSVSTENNHSIIVDKSIIGKDKTKKWDLVTDHENFNKYLKLDDEHCPMPSSLPQDKFKDSSPLEIFSAFFTDELLQHIVEGTNEYLEGERNQPKFKLLKHPPDYSDLTLNEMKVFIAIKIYLNFFQCPRKCGKR